MSEQRRDEESVTATGRRACRAIITLAIVLHLGVCQAGAAQQLPGAADAALAAFVTRVEAYARLHQRLETRFPPLDATTDPLSRLLNRRYLAAAIRAARQNAKQGDIFTPDVAEILRARFAEAMTGPDIGVCPGDDDGWPAAVVNEPFAEGASRIVQPLLLQALPPLPGGIEYRQLGANLVLWDVHADIVIDVLVHAFRPLTHAFGECSDHSVRGRWG